MNSASIVRIRRHGSDTAPSSAAYFHLFAYCTLAHTHECRFCHGCLAAFTRIFESTSACVLAPLLFSLFFLHWIWFVVDILQRIRIKIDRISLDDILKWNWLKVANGNRSRCKCWSTRYIQLAMILFGRNACIRMHQTKSGHGVSPEAALLKCSHIEIALKSIERTAQLWEPKKDPNYSVDIKWGKQQLH